MSALIVGALIYGAMALVTDCAMPWQQVLHLTDANGVAVKWHTGAILEFAMGKLGVGFVALAVCMGIFTGMNGFFMTSSRLLFGMARAKMLLHVRESASQVQNAVCVRYLHHAAVLHLPVLWPRGHRLGR